MKNHDIIVIGASSGGVETLPKLVVQFPEDLPATVFVVQHTAATSPGLLANILDRAGPLPAMPAQNDKPFQQGHLYIAPPDHHLLVKKGYMRVTRGPRENRVRPAIDPLFRSAASVYGARVIGVILTGLQDDGTAGMLAVKRCGGVAMVQDPDDALYSEMPLSVLAHMEVDYRLPVAKMGAVLYRLAYEAPAETPPVPQEVLAEVEIAERPMDNINREEELGALAPLTCPECGGPLWGLHTDQMQRYRCRLGHAFTAQSLLTGQSGVIETALWTAVRTMEERARILILMSHDRQGHGHHRLEKQYKEQAAELKEHAHCIRQLLLGIIKDAGQ
jgi:two-component system chemotaxis response regulator CheB